MIWLQGAICFLLWVGYGIYQSRRSDSVRTWALGVHKTKRVLIATGLMIGTMALVFAFLSLSLRFGGFGNDGMRPVVWVGVGAIGLLFVHGQTLATALLVTATQEAVTAQRRETSTIQSHHEIDSHEAPPS